MSVTLHGRTLADDPLGVLFSVDEVERDIWFPRQHVEALVIGQGHRSIIVVDDDIADERGLSHV